MSFRFADRRAAGRHLARLLADLAGDPSVIVLALPRGGVPVAWEIATALGAPLDVMIVRKLGAPGQPELAAGALASGGIRVFNRDVIRSLRIPEAALDAVAEREQREIERQEQVFRGARQQQDVTGRTVILVDDGVATGSTVRAAVRALRTRQPARLILAVPVVAHDVAQRLRAEVDGLVCGLEPDVLDGVSLWYDDFDQTTDQEVRAFLEASPGMGTGPQDRTDDAP